ncbi:MAG: Asp-tRNA(Asn)/Glu-tRNA(Gln) amidotransferase subunit GatC [Candidatus Paceibacterota bacterium]
MNKEEIKQLATLARIEMSDKEIEGFSKDINEILGYVSAVQDIVDDESGSGSVPEVGARYNVFRKDVITNEPDSYTNDLVAEMPKKQGRYLEVRKILNTDTE